MSMSILRESLLRVMVEDWKPFEPFSLWMGGGGGGSSNMTREVPVDLVRTRMKSVLDVNAPTKQQQLAWEII